MSKHPAVREAHEPGALMTISKFLREVRRGVVDFVVGRVLSGDGDANMESGLDDVTTDYLPHRALFGLDAALAGACNLHALSSNLSDDELSDRFDILSRPRRTPFGDLQHDDATGGEDNAASGSSGGRVKWLGHQDPEGRRVPLIDRAHRLKHLSRCGDKARVNGHVDDNGLGRRALFARPDQALIEPAPAGSAERAILESLSDHIVGRAGIVSPRQTTLRLETPP